MKIKGFNAFDDKDRPSSKIIDDCVHCGFCLSACPTYLETGNELDSPRGRIYLIKSASEGTIPMGDSLVKHLDLCLGCLACETACPSGVKYGNLIETSRSQIERNYGRNWFDKFFRDSLFRIFPYPGRLKFLLPLFYLVKKSGLKKLLKPEYVSRLNKRIGSLYDMLPDVDAPVATSLPEFKSSEIDTRYKVALLTGCIQSVFFQKINDATLNVLTKNGCDVYIPPGQGCCGALSVHSGRLEEGRKFARDLIDSFIELDIDYIIVNSAGCGSTMKEYDEILKDDDHYSKKAETFSGKTMDIMEFISKTGLVIPLGELDMRVTYQDACHIAHGQKIRNEPRELLKKIPGLQLVEMNQADHCCGSAGVYNILQPELSEQILSRKIDNIDMVRPDYLLAGNPGCLLQIQKGFRSRQQTIKTAHPVEVLNWSVNCGKSE